MAAVAMLSTAYLYGCICAGGQEGLGFRAPGGLSGFLGFRLGKSPS